MENTTALASGKVALVTGGARRIGAAIVRELHRMGADIVLHYRSSAGEAQALADDLERQRPGSCITLHGDLLDLDFLASLTRTATRTFGGLDLLVNNASSFYPTALDSAGGRDWEDLMGANLRAPFFLAQAAHGVLRERRGSIVNIVDIYSEHPLRGFPIYSVSKTGLAGLTRSLALELAPEVRVNGVSPGAILLAEGQTAENPEALLAQLPLQRMGEPADIATAVRFLAFEAPYVTGQILTVDGGRSLRL